MASQFLGFMLDAYDMAMVLVMAPILVKVFVSPKGSAAWQYIVTVFSYSITMALRRKCRPNIERIIIAGKRLISNSLAQGGHSRKQSGILECSVVTVEPGLHEKNTLRRNESNLSGEKAPCDSRCNRLPVCSLILILSRP